MTVITSVTPQDTYENRLEASVYLLKPPITEEARATLNTMAPNPRNLRDLIPQGVFFPIPGTPKPPQWASTIQPLVTGDAPIELTGQFPGGVLWVPVNGRVFLVSLGYAHTRLDNEWFEAEFGKIASLSIVPPGMVLEVSAEQVFARKHVASERAPKASDVKNFGFQSDRDLVSAVEGTPRDADQRLVGKRISGSTSFRCSLPTNHIPEALEFIYSRFTSGDHSQSFPEMLNLIAVKDEAAISALDALLEESVTANNAEQRIALVAPSGKVSDGIYPTHFSYGKLIGNPATTPNLSVSGWDHYLRRIGEQRSVNSARGTKVNFLADDKSLLGSTNLYQCIASDVTHQGSPHVLSAGIWYRTNQTHLTQVTTKLTSLAGPQHALPQWDGTIPEGTYNERACQLGSNFSYFDKDLIHYGGGQSKFEFCDIAHLDSRTLYFVKKASASAGMSHLYEQARRTSELFFSPDSTFRNHLKEKLLARDATMNTTWLDDLPKRHEWNLCLVSMGKTANQLPLFAKCGIARLVRELESGGFNISFQSV